MKDDVIGVQHFLRQYHLVLGSETERLALAAEWRDLARHVGRDYFNDPDIHDLFDKKFPVQHQRQQHWVDPYLTDTLRNEAEFSIQRRLHDKSLTTTSMDDRMVGRRGLGSTPRKRTPGRREGAGGKQS